MILSHHRLRFFRTILFFFATYLAVITPSFGQLLFPLKGVDACGLRSTWLDGGAVHDLTLLKDLRLIQPLKLSNQGVLKQGVLKKGVLKQGALHQGVVLPGPGMFEFKPIEFNADQAQWLDQLSLFKFDKTEIGKLSQPWLYGSGSLALSQDGHQKPLRADAVSPPEPNEASSASIDKSDAKESSSNSSKDSRALSGSITDYFHDHSPEDAEHPLDPAIEVARRGLQFGRENIRDYSAVLVKQERINGKLFPAEVIALKIRHDQVATGMDQSPISVYLKFRLPRKVAGREVIWQKGRNGDRLTVHEKVFGIHLKADILPESSLARQGNRYPLTEIGFETLILRMIERGIRDRNYGECQVNIDRSAKINKRKCTMIEIVHPEKREHFGCHIARIYIDDELNVPLRYTAYSWPEEKGGKPILEETYTFTKIKLNVGLTDLDFDYTNPAYNFPE